MPHARLPLAIGLAAAALATTPVTVAVAGPATAASAASHRASAGRPHTTTHRDAAHDVVVETETNSTDTVAAAPGRAQGDVRKLTVTYGARALHLRVTFTDLARPTSVEMHVVRIAAAHHLSRRFALMTSSDQPRGALVFGGMEPPRGCDGVTSHLDYAGNVAWFTVPRACVKGSPWVRVGFGLANVEETDVPSSTSAPTSTPTTSPTGVPVPEATSSDVRTVAYQDDAYLDGTVRGDLVLGPRIYR